MAPALQTDGDEFTVERPGQLGDDRRRGLGKAFMVQAGRQQFHHRRKAVASPALLAAQEGLDPAGRPLQPVDHQIDTRVGLLADQNARCTSQLTIDADRHGDRRAALAHRLDNHAICPQGIVDGRHQLALWFCTLGPDGGRFETAAPDTSQHHQPLINATALPGQCRKPCLRHLCAVGAVFQFVKALWIEKYRSRRLYGRCPCPVLQNVSLGAQRRLTR